MVAHYQLWGWKAGPRERMGHTAVEAYLQLTCAIGTGSLGRLQDEARLARQALAP
jgi:hypothetical protein